MSQDETSSIDNQNTTYGTLTPHFPRSSTVNFENIRPSTPPLHRIDTAPLLSQSLLSDTTIQSTSDQMVSTIPAWSKFGFGLGHVFNDLCAGVWFSYLLLFMKGALRMPGTEAGSMMMLGQVGDALATPVVGMLVDKYGTKQKWHIFGKFIRSSRCFSVSWIELFWIDLYFLFHSICRNVLSVFNISNVIFYLSILWCMAQMVAHRLFFDYNSAVSSWLANSSGVTFVNHSRNGTHTKRPYAIDLSAIFGIGHIKCDCFLRYVAGIEFQSNRCKFKD